MERLLPVVGYDGIQRGIIVNEKGLIKGEQLAEILKIPFSEIMEKWIPPSFCAFLFLFHGFGPPEQIWWHIWEKKSDWTSIEKRKEELIYTIWLMTNCSVHISTPFGKIDIMSDIEIIEIIRAKEWKQGLDRMICFDQRKRKIIVLLNSHEITKEQKSIIEEEAFVFLITIYFYP